MDLNKKSKKSEDPLSKDASFALILRVLKDPILRKRVFHNPNIIRPLIAIGLVLSVMTISLYAVNSQISSFTSQIKVSEDSNNFHQLIMADNLYRAGNKSSVFDNAYGYKQAIDEMVREGYLTASPSMHLGDIKLHQSIFASFIGFSFGIDKSSKDACDKFNEDNKLKSYSSLDEAIDNTLPNKLMCFKNTGKEIAHLYFVGFKV